jgi:metal-dependent amidase/aminoacylase/carboxypeptidase family protein
MAVIFAMRCWACAPGGTGETQGNSERGLRCPLTYCRTPPPSPGSSPSCGTRSTTADNVIPDDARFLASLRTFSPGTRDRAMAAAIMLVSDIASAHGLTATAGFRNGYPVTVNDASEVAFAQDTVAGLLGRDRCVPMRFPLTGAEDFSFVLEQVPGAFVMLGACPRGTDPGGAAFNHSPEAAFDDAVLGDGAALYAELALRRLAAG